ncbi:MAG: hypothetical protein JWO79_1713, partial [Actinomycetia bacterium]|nr:hypothetical protein [Actinomycetes bacterium]
RGADHHGEDTGQGDRDPRHLGEPHGRQPRRREPHHGDREHERYRQPRDRVEPEVHGLGTLTFHPLRRRRPC